MTSWGVMLVLIVLAYVLVRPLRNSEAPHAGRLPTGVFQLPEMFVEMIDGLLVSIIGDGHRGYLPFVATIALFVTASNLAGAIPGVMPPTADLSTVAALGLLAFLVAHATSMSTKGLLRYLHEYFEPFWWLFPINVVGTISRPLSHVFRLYGNMVGGGILVSVAVLLAPWLVPVPLIAWFSIFLGAVQGLVFTLLATVYIAEAIDRRKQDVAD